MAMAEMVSIVVWVWVFGDRVIDLSFWVAVWVWVLGIWQLI